MYHGDTNERQSLELHMISKEGGSRQLGHWSPPTATNPFPPYIQWLLAVTSDTAAKGSTKDLELASAGPVHYYFSLPPFFPYHV